MQIKAKRRSQILCHCLVRSSPANRRKDQKYLHVRGGRVNRAAGPGIFSFSIQDAKKIIIGIFILEIKTKVVNLNFLKTIDYRL